VELEILDEVVRLCDQHGICYVLEGGTCLGAVRHQGFIPWDDDVDIAMPRADYERFIAVAPKELSPAFALQCYETYRLYPHVFAKVCKNHTREISPHRAYPPLPGEHMGIDIDIFPLDASCPDSRARKRLWWYMDVFRNIYDTKRTPVKKGASLYRRVKKLCCTLVPYALIHYLRNRVMLREKTDTGYLTSWGGIYGSEKETHLREVILPTATAQFEGKSLRVPGQWDAYLRRLYGDYMQLPPEAERHVHECDIQFEVP
jgi:lipopolysaccharide cholinephosphotransferase